MGIDNHNHFEFTGAIFKEGKWYVSLCLELDVASQGRSIPAAKKMLAEGVTLHLETCFESNLPYLRPVPKEDDPRFTNVKGHVETFPLKVDFNVHAVV
jgi:predicted RNase H-like HicB family nuclease